MEIKKFEDGKIVCMFEFDEAHLCEIFRQELGYNLWEQKDIFIN